MHDFSRRLARQAPIVLYEGAPLDRDHPSRSARILVVEDDAVVSRAISRALSRLGCEVIAAPSCLAARALACRFELGVFELELGDGSGVDLARAMLDAGQVEFAAFFTAEFDPRRLGQARRLGPLVKKSEGVDALAPVVAGTLERMEGRDSGIRVQPAEPRNAARSAKNAG